MEDFGLTFDSSKYFLGALCKNGHDYEGSGKSLFYLKNKTVCLQCDRERARLYRLQKGENLNQIRRDRRRVKTEDQRIAKQQKIEANIALLKQYGLDPLIYRLSPLCKNGHDWMGTGKTLRKIKTKECPECERSRRRGNKEYRHNYYYSNQSRLLEQKKDYYRRNRDRKLAKDKEYRLANTEKIRDRNRRWHELNKDRQRVRRKAYYERNREQILQQKREYGKQNRNKLRLKWNHWRATPNGRASDNRSKAKRKILRLANHHADFPIESWLERVAHFENRCAYCNAAIGKPHIDHFIPISKGGSHAIGNLIPCCVSCNSSKSNRDPKIWFESQSFYSKKRWHKILKTLGKTETTYNQIPLL